tara:strand:- start:1326 stop:1508 length:183 start_codon:yes stop_codon:yes gene_type:complete
MSHPNGYTPEMIKELLGSSYPKGVEESGNEKRKRLGREKRARGITKDFDSNGKYIYPAYE